MRWRRWASPSPSCRSHPTASPAFSARAAPEASEGRSEMIDWIRSYSKSALALLVLALATAAGPGIAAAAETIKVGFMAPLSGIFAQAGKDMLEGLKLAFEQIGYQSAGRKIELIEEDDEGNPAVAQAKYRKLVTQDRVHVLTGVLLSNIGYGLIPPIERDQLPTLYLTTPDDLTKKHVSKWILRTNFAASQPSRWTTRSATSRSAASSGCSRTRAAASCKRSGCRSTRWTSPRTSRR
ncbi:MAG: hypothetical protein DMD99_16135 [Candidatus Rokuibacteriota bacterium]|nr:MAG: hypothetical protein DMD99_16135 [Candidatus Rokubacteria bacterium]